MSKSRDAIAKATFEVVATQLVHALEQLHLDSSPCFEVHPQVGYATFLVVLLKQLIRPNDTPDG